MKKLTIRGATWKYEDKNPDEDQAILLVHGHPFDHTMWKYQYDVLNNFRLILPDLKGYGESDHDFEKIFIEEQALDLALLLDELKIQKIHLIGLSMGGQIIVEFQRLFPHRVESIILCASLPNAETDDSYKNRIQLADSIEQMGMVQYTKKDIHKYINLNEIDEKSEEYQHLFNMMSETKVKGAVASHRGRAERRDNSRYVEKIRVPSLIIAGEKDYFFNVEKMKDIAKVIPGAQFEVIKKSGHLPNIENHKLFNKLIVGFYNKLKTAANSK